MIGVLKLGGGAGVEHAAALENLARRVQAGEEWVLVHGASDAANRLGEAVGHPAQMLTTPGGHVSRYTDARTIEIYSAAAAGVNQQIVAQLAAVGARPVGLAGPNIITARRKDAIRALRNGRQVILRDDHSGSITGIDSALLRSLLLAGCTPVVAPVAMGEAFERLNVDGDLAAAAIAHALDTEMLVILSNVPGLLRDVADPASLVREFSLADLPHYESFAQGRMKKKLLAAAQARRSRVILADSRRDAPLDAALSGGGTHIIGEVVYAAATGD